MRKDRQFTDPAVPSEEGITYREEKKEIEKDAENNGKKGKKEVISPQAENFASVDILEIKIGPNSQVKTRLIKAEPQEFMPKAEFIASVPVEEKPICFEENRWPYILALPLMWVLTIYVMAKKAVYKLFGKSLKINTFWFDGLGLSCQKVKEGCASWQALDEIYNYQFGNYNGLNGLVSDFWEGMLNCQAVRNRLKLVKQEIRSAIFHFSSYREVRLLSLAAGSAQGVIEIMAEFKARGVRVRTILVDIDQSALDYANRLAIKNGVLGQVETIKVSASQVARISRRFKPHIIEMIGLLDYIPQNKAVRLCNKIYESLAKKGFFLTGNINHNIEKFFLRWVVNWQMIYRAPEELTEIIRKSGFSDLRLVYEPLSIHGLVIAQK